MTCPICARPTDPRLRPFCSRRCADIDLGQWLTGGYAIPVTDDPDSAPEEPGDTDPERPAKPH